MIIKIDIDVLEAIDAVMKLHVFERNDETTWKSVLAHMDARLGIFLVENKIADYVIICNRSNNDPTSNELICMVGIKFNEDDEFLDRSATITPWSDKEVNSTQDAYDYAMGIL